MTKETWISGILCLIVGVYLTYYGFSFGINNFSPNLIAGWAQFFVQIAIGIFFIDNFIERQDEKKWAKVRKIKYRNLKEHLVKFMDSLAQEFSYVEISKNLLYSKKSGKDLSPAIENLIKELNYLDTQDDNIYRPVFIRFYELVKDEVKEIKTSFIPDIIDITNNQNFVDKLTELDSAFIKFEDAIIKTRLKESASFDIETLVELLEYINEIINKL